jgi:hypothetical protein
VTPPVFYTPVMGTGAYHRRQDASQWFLLKSPFERFLASHGVEQLEPGDPFIWSTDVNGVKGWLRWFGNESAAGDHQDWHAGGLALKWRMQTYPRQHRTMIAHSHGGQLAAYAAAEGLQIPVLVTVATPVRRDMSHVWKRARPNIGCHLHLYAPGGDWIQILGQWGDGLWSSGRKLAFTDADGRERWGAHLNHAVPLMQHSRILSDPTCFAWWVQNGWIDLMRQESGAAA